GGFVYRGEQIPELQGMFVFGDIVNGRLFYSELDAMLAADLLGGGATAPVHELLLTYQGQPVTLEALILAELDWDELANERIDLRFGQTDDGEIYVLTK